MVILQNPIGLTLIHFVAISLLDYSILRSLEDLEGNGNIVVPYVKHVFHANNKP